MENNEPMDYKGIRAQARQNLAGKWGLSIGVAAVACLLGGMITGSNFLPTVTRKLSDAANGIDLPTLISVLGFSMASGLIGLVIFLIGGTIELGHAQFLLKQHDGQEPTFGDLFSQFHRFGQGFAQHFLIRLYVFLWMLLFIIPGIVKSLSYAMTPFIMADHPELSASEAITRSREMMNGHKLDLFVLNMSFFGWMILCALTMSLGNLFLNPYRNAAHAVFYRQIAGQNRYAEF